VPTVRFPPPDAAAIARARSFATKGASPVPAVPAATLVLVRDHPLRVLLVHRAAGLSFAGGHYAFPGGKVDESDDVLDDRAGLRDADPGRGAGARATAARDPSAAFRRAAVRETAEETGLVVEPADLRLWSIWLTPPYEPRRFETYFFVAPAPETTRVVLDAAETQAAYWVEPAAALHAAQTRGWLMLPPTLYTLAELAEFRSTAQVLQAEHRVRRFALTIDLTADPPCFVNTAAP
jgi:8-oxo-dGTP pyrophosphatase MutT (NUDIX family)